MSPWADFEEVSWLEIRSNNILCASGALQFPIASTPCRVPKNCPFGHMHLRSGTQPAAMMAPYAGYYRTVSARPGSGRHEDQQHIGVWKLAVEWPSVVARDPPLYHTWTQRYSEICDWKDVARYVSAGMRNMGRRLQLIVNDCGVEQKL